MPSYPVQNPKKLYCKQNLQTYGNNSVLADKQKDSRRRSNLLSIQELAKYHTAFIDYKKAYDSIAYSWLVHVFQLYKIHLTLIMFHMYNIAALEY